MVTKLLRHFDHDERQTDAAVHWDSMRPVLLRALADKGAHVFSEQEWKTSISNKEVARSGSSVVKFLKKSWAYLRAIQGHTSGITIAPELMGHVLLPYTWKELLYHKGCSFNMKSILEHGLIAGGKETKEGRRTIFFTPLTEPFWERWGGRSSSWRPVSSEKVSLQQQLETWSRRCLLGKLIQSTGSRITIWADEITCDYRTQSFATGFHLKGHCQERRTDTLR